MKKSIWIFCLMGMVLCQTLPGVAQQSSRIEQPKLAVKWSPLHLIYFYPSFQVALEHKLTQHINLQYDLGWILNYPASGTEEFSNKSGYRGIAELRYYLPSPPKIPFYLAGEYYYSRVTFDRSEVIGYDCVSGNCDYFQYATYKVVHHNQGAGMKFGLLLFPGWNKNRSFFFDINVGMAYRSILYTDIGKPIAPGSESFDNHSDDIFAPTERDHGEFRLVVGVRLGYRIF
ncbi:hypothetical protein [Chryseolinea soli]|uniref:DUF3575 domain-containing protein n=1 Tax=Chryseolinea soli TaxID=2321403 RepID=A0A385SUY4_9BACT|nr:hypothetical protein [Chryseolinea soli]AYB33957.1 hypothetical protein D4L85_26755 [Chryseolinea soli]